MSQFKAFCLFGIWLFCSAFKFIPQGANETILEQAQKGQALIFSQRYDEAKKLFQGLMVQYPNSPLGSFGLMALYNARMFENFDFTLDTEFEPIQKQNKILVDKIDKSKDSSAWDDFLCGASSGLRGFYFIRKDANLKALGEAKQARRCLERALQKDPRFMDVYLGLGLYDYWTGVFSTRFKFLPLFKDKRKEGIAAIQKAIQEGAIANDLATVALIFVYQEGRQGVRGLPLAEGMLKTYPDNIILLSMQGNFLSYVGKHEAARGVFDKVLTLNPTINVARYYKAMDYYRSRLYTEAKQTFRDFIDHKPSPAWTAYAYYMLGQLEFQENNRQGAFDNFKAGYKAYSDYTPNLKMILKMRKEAK